MKYDIYKRLLKVLLKEYESFEMLISADNVLGLNVSSDDIINYLEFSLNGQTLSAPILGNIIITEGDIISILKILNDIAYYENEYILYINNDNIGTITYLVSRANEVYKELNVNVKINIDYSENYNAYLNELVTIIGSDDFVNTACNDFVNANQIIV